MNLETLRYVYLRRVVATALGALGIEVSTALARRLARGVYDLNTPGRRRAEARLQEALGPAACPTDVGAVVSAMYDHLGRFWPEVLFAGRLLRDSSWRRFVRVEGETALRSLAQARHGCLIATSYFGNPAVCALALGQLFRPVYVIVDLFVEPTLRLWQQELYSQRWVRPIDRRDAVTVVPKVLQHGGAVLMICEHHRPRGRAVPVAFLGQRLDCYPTLGRLARWFDVPIAIVTCRRRRRTFSFALHCHATLERPSQLPCGLWDTLEAEELVRRTLAELERAIMARPEQYLWSMPLGPSVRHSDASQDMRPITERETGSASCRTRRQTGSASQRPSAADRTPGSRVAVAEPAPTA